jgi:F-type H+-transporting ATPase subunit gamma
MKALAASQIVQYEKSVSALADYYRTVQLGLSTCFKRNSSLTFATHLKNPRVSEVVSAIVFGSDQGLVGQFNEVVVDYTVKVLAALPGKAQVWAVGERVHTRLIDLNLQPRGLFNVPTSVKAITPLIDQILMESESLSGRNENVEFFLFYNRPETATIFSPVSQRLLPLDRDWQCELAQLRWPTENIPEVLGNATAMLQTLIGEYLFVSLFKACAGSLASENASRLVAMQRAEKNIDELLHELTGKFHRSRQDNIDEELFDVISGFEALSVVSRTFRRAPI